MKLETKNNMKVTPEEVKNLERMQKELLDSFNRDARYGRKRDHTYEEQICINTAATGYAIVTDILQRGKNPGPHPPS